MPPAAPGLETIRALYEAQHKIWPGWSASEGDADAAAAQITALAGDVPSRTVLDMGCGVGRECLALARTGWCGVGVDLSEKLIVDARIRLADAGFASRFSFTVADYRDYIPPAPPGLIYFWDSALNLLPPSGMAAVARRCASQLEAGGTLLIQQLAREHFEEVEETYRIADPALGPGHTDRRYTWHTADGVLEDRITYHPPHGAPVNLPVQRLYLPSAESLADLLRSAGLENVRVVGSAEWSWLPGGQTASRGQWRAVIAIGDKPAATTRKHGAHHREKP